MIKDELILLVEDNDDDVFLMKRALKGAGILNPLAVVEDGQSAIDYLSRNGKYSDETLYQLPSLIFLDLKLPLVRGLDVLAWIKKNPRFATIIVIVLTSSEEPSDLKDAYQLGANSYLVKPPSAPGLLKLATAVKNYWVDHNEFESTRTIATAAEKGQTFSM